MPNGKFLAAIPSTKLNNGLLMPRHGFGTNTLKGEIGERSVYDAISAGYRHIDTAMVCQNEEAVGAGAFLLPWHDPTAVVEGF